MRNASRVRIGVSTAVAALALAGASQASAAINASFAVSSDEATNKTAITYEQKAADDTLARITLFAPTSVFMPAAQLPGDLVGTATLTTAGGVVNATIVAADRTITQLDASGTPTPLTGLWTPCVGSPPPSAANTSNYWMIAAGATQIPIYFASINQDQPLGDAFLAQINICFPAASKVTKVVLNLVQAVSTSPGVSIWHVRANPWAGTEVSATTGAEAEAQDRLPWDVTLSAKRKKVTGKSAKARNATKDLVAVSGRVTSGDKGAAGATVKLKAGSRIVATLKTRADGRYQATIKTTATKLAAHATAGARTSSKCTEPKFAPLPCTGSSVSGLDLTGDAVAVGNVKS